MYFKNKKIGFKNIRIHIILIITFIILLIPVVLMISTSLKQGGFSNYITVSSDTRIPRSLLNSLIISVPSVIIVVFISSLTAFALSKLKIIAKGVIFSIFLAGLMIPVSAIIVQLFIMIVKFRLVNNYLSVILPVSALVMPFGLLVLKNYMDDIPNEIIEAALIDGCTPFAIYMKIMFPLSLPAVASVTIFTFLASWNEFLMPLLFLRKQSLMPATVIPTLYMGDLFGSVSLWMTSFVMLTLPVLVLYLIFQRYFIKGLTAGAIK